ncbi:MAG: hypothetical protein EOP04_06720 [Proteobacteria bacterium]|nr:MAG: hypothetical protein EOP04_06720 [Pseudomonadota bacterium]
MPDSFSDTLRLRHPMVLAALVLLLLNDHVFKQSSYAGFLTGKISDFAGLFFFPFFVADVLQLKRNEGFGLICVMTGLGFMALKLSTEFRDAYVFFHQSLGVHSKVVLDASDLWALLVLPLAVWFECTLSQKGGRFV